MSEPTGHESQTTASLPDGDTSSRGRVQEEEEDEENLVPGTSVLLQDWEELPSGSIALAEYAVEFSTPHVGIILETDGQSRLAIVKGFAAPDGETSAAEALGFIQPGHILIALNEESVLGHSFQETMALLKSSAIPRKLRFLDPAVRSLELVIERIEAGVEARDAYGFNRRIKLIEKEKVYRSLSYRKLEVRDKAWIKFLNKHKGIEGLKAVMVNLRAPPGGPKVFPRGLKRLVRRGIPVAFRAPLWKLLADVEGYRRAFRPSYYSELSCSSEIPQQVLDGIEKDLDRTFPDHELFQTSEGLEALRKVLRAYAMHNPSIGYCQSMNFITGLLLLFLDEEDAFWMLVNLMEKLLPADYYTDTMIGIHVDQRVFGYLLTKLVPTVASKLAAERVQLHLITLQWFLCLFVNTLPIETVLRVWDVFFLEGVKVLFRVGIAIIKVSELKLLAAVDGEEVYRCTKGLGQDIHDADKLLKLSYMKRGGPLFRSASKLKGKVEEDLSASLKGLKSPGALLSPSKSPASSGGEGSDDSFHVTNSKGPANPFKSPSAPSLNWRGFSSKHIKKWRAKFRPEVEAQFHNMETLRSNGRRSPPSASLSPSLAPSSITSPPSEIIVDERLGSVSHREEDRELKGSGEIQEKQHSEPRICTPAFEAPEECRAPETAQNNLIN